MNFGIMQGRFTESGGFNPQRFPWDNWKNEFEVASKNGLTCIEWMFNFDKYFDNPLFTEDGKKQIKTLIQDSGIKVDSVCANYYMTSGLYKDEGLIIFKKICECMNIIGARIIVIPLFEDNEPVCKDEERLLILLLKEAEEIAKFFGIKVALETDWEPWKVLEFISRTDNTWICYDIGNAAGNGRDTVKEIEAFGGSIISVHAKDKQISGTSVMLGEGTADIKGAFCALNNMGYKGNIILESYYGVDAVMDTLRNLDHLRRCCI